MQPLRGHLWTPDGAVLEGVSAPLEVVICGDYPYNLIVMIITSMIGGRAVLVGDEQPQRRALKRAY